MSKQKKEEAVVAQETRKWNFKFFSTSSQLCDFLYEVQHDSGIKIEDYDLNTYRVLYSFPYKPGDDIK